MTGVSNNKSTSQGFKTHSENKLHTGKRHVTTGLQSQSEKRESRPKPTFDLRPSDDHKAFLPGSLAAAREPGRVLL